MSVLLDSTGVPIKDPRAPNDLRQCEIVARLLDVPAVMFVTSTRFGRIVQQMSDPESGYVFRDPVRPTPQNCDRLQFGLLTVANAKTEDEQAVETANWLVVPESFLARKRNLIAGKGERRVPEVEKISAS